MERQRLTTALLAKPDGVDKVPKEKKTAGSVLPPVATIAVNPEHASTIQHNQGPGATKEYGTSVPVEGKRNEGPTDFNHPASVEPQRIIWIPRDPLELSTREVEQLNAEGVEASAENATIDAGGHVDIQGHPPGSDPRNMFN